MRKDEARQTIEELMLRWRAKPAEWGSERRCARWALPAAGRSHARDYEELELRVAQLEHRIRLLEGGPRAVPDPPY